ncbi:peptidoglycan-binding domain-containing protein [Streptomyces sp. NPDC049577]|uniref:peptidoglycan-binding domain-containing protein n=1 Tax=Streptomyces sp. NPDC049577 TaxID=3155153 RepID=UPI003432A1D4
MKPRKFAAVTGVIGAALAVTTAVAVPAGAAPNVPNIHPGSRNHYGVTCVQEGILDWIVRTKQNAWINVDGQYGDETYRWLLKFQRASGLEDDGIVGPRTGNSILDNLTGDTTITRRECYPHIPSTHR